MHSFFLHTIPLSQSPTKNTALKDNHHHHHFWQAPLRVHSAERRHQSPEWTVLSQVNCIIHIEFAGFQIVRGKLLRSVLSV